MYFSKYNIAVTLILVVDLFTFLSAWICQMAD